MEINTLGLTAAVVTFFSIWAGHVTVRKVESISKTIWIPLFIFALLGVVGEYISWLIHPLSLKVVFGILGVTLFWDAFEMVRQEKRVIKGHAPANPRNPRHALFLAAPNTRATLVDLLNDGLSDDTASRG